VKFNSDIDIDFADRNAALALIQHHPAGVIRDGKLQRHNTGIYVTDIATDPFTGIASIDHKEAETRGYVKLDLLNMSVYALVRSPEHLEALLNTEPPWHRLYDPEFCAQLTHMGNHYDTLIQMPEAVNSIPRLAMFLAIIRPAKRHLIGRPWAEVAQTIWSAPTDGSYAFKKSHAVSYAHLVTVHMNLISESAPD